MKSLRSSWPFIRKKLQQADELVLFLDYDGTVTPICSHPDQAKLSPQARDLLEQVVRQPWIWVALVSGRALKDLKRMTDVGGICYVGNHGLELEGPKLRHVNPAALKARPLLKQIFRRLTVVLKPIAGAWVEDKGLTLTVHLRQVKQDDKFLVRNLFHEVVRPYREKKQVRITAGKEVFEVRPPVRWTKGTVVRWLLARRNALHPTAKVLPIYIGDDLTDEDAFQALGAQGVSVLVGSPNPLSRAQFRVASVDEALRFLQLLLEVWKGKGSRAG